MKRICIALLIILLVFALAACSGTRSGESTLDLVAYSPEEDEGDVQPETDSVLPEADEPSPDEEVWYGNEIHEAVVDAVGMTYDELKAIYPDAYTDIEGDGMYNVFYNAAFPYMAIPGFEFGFVFFGTQWGPPLTDIVNYFGDEITCIGATGNVRGIFPGMTEAEISFDDFFSFLGVEDYDFFDFGDPNYPDAGLEFEFMDFTVYVDVSIAPEQRIIKSGAPVLVYHGDLMLNDKYLKMTDDIIRGEGG